MIIKAAKRIFNSDKICCSYCDFYFGVTFLEHTVVTAVTCNIVGVAYVCSTLIYTFFNVLKDFFVKIEFYVNVL